MEIAGEKIVGFWLGGMGQKAVAGNRGNLGLVAVTRQHFGAKSEKCRNGVTILFEQDRLLFHFEQGRQTAFHSPFQT
jgi:hypothetical protein